MSTIQQDQRAFDGGLGADVCTASHQEPHYESLHLSGVCGNFLNHLLIIRGPMKMRTTVAVSLLIIIFFLPVLSPAGCEQEASIT